MPSSPSTRPKAVKPASRPRIFERVGASGLIVLALTTIIPIWAWQAFVVGHPQDFAAFGVIFLVVLPAGAIAQVFLAVYVRASGSLRDRATLESDAQPSDLGVYLPLAAFLITALVATPPATSATQFEPGMSIYAVMALMTAVGLAFTLLGYISYLVICFPLALVLRGILPQRTQVPHEERMDRTTRVELVSGGLIIPFAMLFGISMAFMGQTGAVSGNGRMLDQFLLLVTGHGAVTPTILVIISIVAMVLLVVIHNRAYSRRRHAGGESSHRPAATALASLEGVPPWEGDQSNGRKVGS